VPETERLPAAAYTPEVTAQVYAALAAKARRVLAAGHSAIVDAVFAGRVIYEIIVFLGSRRQRQRREKSDEWFDCEYVFVFPSRETCG